MNHCNIDMFSHDGDLASMMLSSDLFNKALTAICDTPVSIDDQDPFSISIHVSEDLLSNGKIIAFRSSPDYTVQNLHGEEVKALVPSTGTFFDFMSTEVNPRISINKVAVDVFSSLENHLSVLQDQIIISKPLIVTGNSLGGSIASLFTIWLLDTVYSNKSERPICITFGAPLLGDISFRKAIYQRSSWPSCFVHVALTKDPIPKLFVSTNYNPFGLFFFCSDSGCVCIDHPESVIEVMVVMKSVGDTDLSVVPFEFYGRALVDLKRNATYKGNSVLGEADIDSLQAGIFLQLEAIEVIRKQEEARNDIKGLIGKIEKTKKIGIRCKRNVMDAKKKLNDTKIIMNNLEWYKKATIDDGGYYDGYKNPNSIDKKKSKVKINKDNSILENYWEEKVGEAKEKPQKEAVSFRNSWLFAGTNYRRMVEPLHIAEHYLSGKTDYVRTARPEHFILLEKWFNDDKKTEKHMTAASLTEDSCFWAHVEEAVISLNVLTSIQSCDVKKGEAVIKLNGFEDYVMRLIEGYAVSPEIFLPKSTFMKWWEEYKQYKDGATRGGYTSPLADFMMNKRQLYK